MSMPSNKNYLIHLYKTLVEEFCFDYRGRKLEDSYNCTVEMLLAEIKWCTKMIAKRRKRYYNKKKKLK